MDPYDAFVCFANLLNKPVHIAAFTLNQEQMTGYAYAKAMPLNVVCRVWDVFLHDEDEFLLRTGLDDTRLQIAMKTVQRLAECSKRYGLFINRKKTQILANGPHREVRLYGATINYVDRFLYLV